MCGNKLQVNLYAFWTSQRARFKGQGLRPITPLGILGPQENKNGQISAPMARQKLSTSEINIGRRAGAIGRGPRPWKEAPDPKNCSPDPKSGVGGMAKPLNLSGFLPRISSLSLRTARGVFWPDPTPPCGHKKGNYSTRSQRQRIWIDASESSR